MTIIDYVAVPQLSINGTIVDSVTDVFNESQYHVKEDAGFITLCIRLEFLPVNKTNLTIEYSTSQRSACEYCSVYITTYIATVIVLYSYAA